MHTVGKARKSISLSGSVLAGITVCALALATGCSSTASSTSATPASSLTLVAQPDDKTATLEDVFASAKSSIDIVIYQVDNPTVEESLVAAMQRGVVVRMILDGDASNQNRTRKFVQRVRAQMTESSIAPDRFQPNWSNNNFSLTHQKSIIIDAGSKPESASRQLIISTGNFADSKRGKFYQTRDFYLGVRKPELINQALRIFNSDFSCADRFTTNGLAAAPPPLLWSNGTTDMYAPSAANPLGTYPGRIEGYFSQQVAGSPTDQGNVNKALLDLIASATEGSIVRVYGEELGSLTYVQALVNAATPVSQGGQGADVRIVMSYRPVTSSDKTILGIKQVVKAGAKATLMADQDDKPDALYIHAKMITVTQPSGESTGFVGSQNLTDPSLRFNRELGYLFTNEDSATLAQLNKYFDSDLATTTDAATLTPDNSEGIPKDWSRGKALTESGPTLSHPRAVCGPVT